MKIGEIDWTQAYRDCHSFVDGTDLGGEDARARWDARAANFARKAKRSDYTHQLLEILNLKGNESVFDMGCGNGALAVPLAEADHTVVAVDFSPKMLAELDRSAKEKGIADKIQIFNRSWQEPWDDLPKADIALSSRSFVIADLEKGIDKLESQARQRVVLTCGAGERPYKDARILRAMGREKEASEPPNELAVIANYLWVHGRLPRITYIEYPGVWSRPSCEELKEAISSSHTPRSDQEAQALSSYLDNHIVFKEEDNCWALDYARQDRWGVLDWMVQQSEV